MGIQVFPPLSPRTSLRRARSPEAIYAQKKTAIQSRPFCISATLALLIFYAADRQCIIHRLAPNTRIRITIIQRHTESVIDPNPIAVKPCRRFNIFRRTPEICQCPVANKIVRLNILGDKAAQIIFSSVTSGKCGKSVIVSTDSLFSRRFPTACGLELYSRAIFTTDRFYQSFEFGLRGQVPATGASLLCRIPLVKTTVLIA